jgi:hypothetical protein
MSVMIAKNQTADNLALSKLSSPDGVIPASGQVELTLFNAPEAIQNDTELQAYINAGSLLLEIDGVTLTAEQTASLPVVQHMAIRQLIHFIDSGPAEGFASGAYRQVTGTTFPTAIIWYDKAGVGKKKIVEKTIAWTGVNPTTITWKIYDSAETLLATVADAISYSGAFETSRTRTIS